MSSLNIPLPPTPAPGEGPATPAPPSPAPTPVLPDDSAFVTALMRRFVAGVKPRDISWKGARHANVFVGADAVDWLAENAVPGRDVSRSDATAIGELLRSRGLFAHHVYPEHAFMDEFHFYRYAPLADELAAEPQPLLEQPKPSAVDAWMQNMRRPSVAKIEKGQRIGNDDDVYTIVVLGASGDLAYKKTFPSLYGVWTQGFMPKNVKIFGYARSKIEHDDFISRVTSKIKVDKGCESVMEDFKSSLAYISGQYDQPESFQKLDAAIKEYEGQFASVAKKNRMFYLALPPSVFAEVSKHLKEQCYPTSGWARLVVEKPFGHDLASSNALSASLAQYWNESEIFRIDHYLGKDMSKNLLVLRFANRFFGGIWDRDSIENVQITFKETIGTEGRGGYFDEVRRSEATARGRGGRAMKWSSAAALPRYEPPPVPLLAFNPSLSSN